jgi:hypothetical protein
LFFILVALVIVAVVVLLALLLKINLLIKGSDSQLGLTVKTLGVAFIHRKYEIRHESGDIFTLYCVDKPKPRRVISLLDIIKTINKPKQPKSNEQARGKLFAFINSKSKYHLRFRLDIGLEDAFATAMLCGIIQSAVGVLSALIKKEKHKIEVKVAPVFSKRSFSWHTDCIITLSLANIIIGYLMYKINKRR